MGMQLKRVQIAIEADLLEAVDKAARRMGTTRSAFACKALQEALRRLAVQDQQSRHREGYESYPVKQGEFSEWEDEQKWGDD
jgi:metal-responsive CopG/Arc/MetJ family transcriptional regulator